MLLLSSIALAIYAVLSGVLVLRVSRTLKIFLAVLVFAIAFKYQWYTLGSGTLIRPSVSNGVMIAFESLYGGLIFFVFLLVIKDLINFGLWLLKQLSVLGPISLNKNVIIGVLAVVSLLTGAWGTWEALRVPSVKQVVIKSKNLPQAWNGTRIVQLSDLHIGPLQRRKWLQSVVDKVNALEPDFVFITGDFVDGSVHKLIGELSPLTQIDSEYGVYGIPGNHEYYSGYRSWMSALSSLGIKMLRNQSVVIDKDGSLLTIGGTTDFGASRFHEMSPNVFQTFAQSPEDSFRILLTHQPKTTYRTRERFDLQFSGHTHGGHIFFLYPLIAYFNDGMVRGLYQKDDRQIYVSPGTGLWNGFSVRIGVPSEITEIILEKG